MVAHELGLPVELHVLHDMSSVDGADYGGHPALKIPTLHVNELSVFGSDNICRKLAQLAGRADDPRVVLSHHVSSDLVRNAQELVSHAMAVHVQLILGVQMAKLPSDSAFFTKSALGMRRSLAWLDERLERVLAELPAQRAFSVFEVSLFCLLDHLDFRPTVPRDELLQLGRFAEEFAARASARNTPYCFDPPNVRPAP
jgi:glutathione S-transferase